MSAEADLLRRLRAMASDLAARGLMDDVAVMPTMGQQLVITSDTMVEGVHFRADDPPETVGWKLAAVNLSDLAAKGAVPVACLLNYGLTGQAGWDEAFLDGLGRALRSFGMHLIGGDTVKLPTGAPRVLSLTAMGEVPANEQVPARTGARPGDRLFVSGPIGDAGAGLALLDEGLKEPAELIRAYRVPTPHITLGQTLSSQAHAMMDVSDGLLIDAQRMALASDCAVEINQVPLSDAYVSLRGNGIEARLAAATHGDDYVLLVALPGTLASPRGLLEVGRFKHGEGLTVRLDGKAVPLPARLGYEHG
ncbi:MULTISPECIES: thiamine-phosphate kinase [unclassified Sphingobium]|uniref:thiamine-phosphate kinase n=1 Tax=unclassified Sphingobium TaxID=2611147 RepID=UPI0022241E37|nr:MULTISPECIES: thiamine-phosphate kinase [unclassified Sphingobium]MCW2382957.1 thiamine-monophosphate kinase [Sphingobium sp. B2D3B]MCW2400067.1 thiamine-monophosphate kinase [Sphingobium sp. B2D3C]